MPPNVKPTINKMSLKRLAAVMCLWSSVVSRSQYVMVCGGGIGGVVPVGAIGETGGTVEEEAGGAVLLVCGLRANEPVLPLLAADWDAGVAGDTGVAGVAGDCVGSVGEDGVVENPCSDRCKMTVRCRLLQMEGCTVSRLSACALYRVSALLHTRTGNCAYLGIEYILQVRLRCTGSDCVVAKR